MMLATHFTTAAGSGWRQATDPLGIAERTMQTSPDCLLSCPKLCGAGLLYLTNIFESVLTVTGDPMQTADATSCCQLPSDVDSFPGPGPPDLKFRFNHTFLK